MTSTYNFREDCKYVIDKYKGYFSEIYVKNFFMRIGKIANCENTYDGYVNKEKFIKVIDFLQIRIKTGIKKS
jgi:uncharacterized protein (UPF0305 family)